MSARTPEEVHPLFARHFAAADLAGLLFALRARCGAAAATGRGRARPRRHPRVAEQFSRDEGPFRIVGSKIVTAGDIAIGYVDWTLDAKAPDGSPIHLEGTTTDVMRRQPTGAGSSRSTARSAPAAGA